MAEYSRGQAWGGLKKSWRGFKSGYFSGDYDMARSFQAPIHKFQEELDLPQTNFRPMSGYNRSSGAMQSDGMSLLNQYPNATADHRQLCQGRPGNPAEYLQHKAYEQEMVRSMTGLNQQYAYDTAMLSGPNQTYAYDTAMLSGPNQDFAYDTAMLSGPNQDFAYDTAMLSGPNQDFAYDTAMLSGPNQTYAYDTAMLSGPNQTYAYDTAMLSGPNQDFAYDTAVLSGDSSPFGVLQPSPQPPAVPGPIISAPSPLTQQQYINSGQRLPVAAELPPTDHMERPPQTKQPIDQKDAKQRPLTMFDGGYWSNPCATGESYVRSPGGGICQPTSSPPFPYNPPAVPAPPPVTPISTTHDGSIKVSPMGLAAAVGLVGLGILLGRR